MKGKQRSCAVLVYNSFLDPLVQNLMLKYVKTLADTTGATFHLITFEQGQYAICPDKKATITEELARSGIFWYAFKHHTGSFLILKKFYDFLSLSLLFLQLRVKGVSIIFSFANVAASIAWVYSKLLSFKTVIFSFEPHSTFMVELNLWSRKSLNFRILNYLEWKAGLQADFVLTGTRFMKDELLKKGATGKVFRAPTGVDENEFDHRPTARQILQQRHRISDEEKVFLYIGKFGGLYYEHEVILFLKVISENVANARFIIVTSTPESQIKNFCKKVDFKFSALTILSNISYEEVKIYISGSDMGISAVPPTESQKFRSPTKVAEYLLCGLPYITCKGVSEDDIVAEKYDVGVVLENFDVPHIQKAIPEINRLLTIPRTTMIVKCREVGLFYRSKSNVDNILREIFAYLWKKY